MSVNAKDITTADVVFTEATPEQRILAWRLNGASWAAPMDVETYVRRENRLSETTLSRDGGTKYFILHPRGHPLEIVSGLEVTTKRILVSDEAGSREAKAYAIASVYTNPDYREKGMASFMLRKLQEFMDEDSEASALYSDIGTVYYARLGWAVYPSLQVSLYTPKESPAAPSGVRYLAREGIEALCEKDVASLRAKFDSLPKGGKTHVTFTPSWPQVDWHFTRDGFMADALRSQSITHRGAATEDGASWVCWDHDFRENKIKIIRLVAATPDAIRPLLEVALVEAFEWDLEKVLVWNPDEDVSAAAKAVSNAKDGAVKVVFDERLDGSIPSLRWKGGKEVETIWEYNDYYSWC